VKHVMMALGIGRAYDMICNVR